MNMFKIFAPTPLTRHERAKSALGAPIKRARRPVEFLMSYGCAEDAPRPPRASLHCGGYLGAFLLVGTRGIFKIISKRVQVAQDAEGIAEGAPTLGASWEDFHNFPSAPRTPPGRVTGV